jgi:hypothetical protein
MKGVKVTDGKTGKMKDDQTTCRMLRMLQDGRDMMRMTSLASSLRTSNHLQSGILIHGKSRPRLLHPLNGRLKV